MDEKEYCTHKASPDVVRRVVRKKRQELNLTQAQIAELLNVNYRKVSDWESGRVKYIQEPYRSQLFKILNIDEERDMIEVILPSIAKCDLEYVYVKDAIAFLNYVVSRVNNSESRDFLNPLESDPFIIRARMLDLMYDYYQQKKF